LEKLKISFASFYQWFAFNTQPFSGLIRREYIHGEHLWLFHEHVFVFWKTIERCDLLNFSAVWTLNAHHRLAMMSLLQYLQALLAKSVTTLQNTRYFEFFIKRICAYLTLNLLYIIGPLWDMITLNCLILLIISIYDCWGITLCGFQRWRALLVFILFRLIFELL